MVMARKKLDAVVVVGPTASGKSALALRFAEERNGEIISADCMAVYKGFDIGTAKPSADEMSRVPFHLIDVVEPTTAFNVAMFQSMAMDAVRHIQGRGRIPVIVGGTGLYVRALLRGFSLPPAVNSPEIRKQLIERAQSGELAIMHDELQKLDPDAAAKIHPNDMIRLTRALEVIMTTGKSFSQQQQAVAPPELSNIAVFGLQLTRDTLVKRIEDRCHKMIEAGWLDEVRQLLQDGVPVDSPAMRSLGYRELAEVSSGSMSLEDAIPEIIKQTRQYAKRQMTWFRKEENVVWLDASRSEESLYLEMLTSID